MSHKFSIRLRSGLHDDQGIVVIAFRCRKCTTATIRWGLALSSINTGLVIKAWLSKWGTTTVSRMSLWYLGPLWLPWQWPDLTYNHEKRIPTPSQNQRQMEWFPGYYWRHWWYLVASTHGFSHQSEESCFHPTNESLFTMQDSIYGVPDTMPNMPLCMLVSEGDVL